MSEKKYVGIAEMIISDRAGDQLIAPNLGSCLGIVAYDAVRKHGGMIHCLLPMSGSDPEKAKSHPCMYVDSGVTLMFNSLVQRGSKLSDLRISVAGGSQINDAQGVFNIGKKNYTIFRKILWKNSLLIAAEDVGGSVPRTVTLEIASGEVWLRVGANNFRLN